MIPQLRDLEHRYPDALAIVGVHSGKYIAERVTARIREAALRLGNVHAMVNDRQFRVWRSYAVNAWPTLVIVDPNGRVLATRPGEFTADALAPTLEQLIAAYQERGALRTEPLRVAPDTPAIAPGRLRYPGKVAVDGARIAIADTGHDRVLIARLDVNGRRATVERTIGDGMPGFDDGAEARFRMPQGLAFAGDTLFIADAGNHAIRAAALGGGVVRTIAGTGTQLRTREDMRRGALSSPWDVAQVGSTLYIAMAGIHQLWALDLASGALRPHSGGFREAIEDGSNADASLAQPMGIVSGGGRLWFVDAESSAARWSDIDPSGRVGTLVGTGLFDFGDEDGVGDDVRLQHPQGIARHADGRLLIADSYNDALKWLDPATRRVTTWVRGLHEPAGVAFGERHAYVADTNAHRVAWVELASGESGELELDG